jgi:hypothetical protein
LATTYLYIAYRLYIEKRKGTGNGEKKNELLGFSYGPANKQCAAGGCPAAPISKPALMLGHGIGHVAAKFRGGCTEAQRSPCPRLPCLAHSLQYLFVADLKLLDESYLM